MAGYYLEDLYKPDPDHPVRQALSARHNFRVIIEKLNDTVAVVNNLVVRNNIVYTYIESVDATYPFEMDFHIPTAIDAIKKISLTLKGVPFRAYSKAGAATGSASGGADTSGATTGTSGFVITGLTSQLTGVGDQSASGYIAISSSAKFIADKDHTHATPDHTHPNHQHTAVYGIFESTTPTAVNGYYDNGSGYGSADSYGNAPDTTTPWNIKTEYDLTSYYTTAGWKRLKLDTSRLGRFNVILMIEVDLTPTA